MISYQKGDILLVAFPFTGNTGTKTRPALVVLDTGDADVLLARITTQPPAASNDVNLADWALAGLRAASVVRLHKLATIEKAQVVRPLGQLSVGDRQLVAAILNQNFGAW